MTDTIYIERDVRNHPRVEKIIAKHARARIIECEHYGEIFNRKGQNFRLQKQAPALILANKRGRKIYPTPPDHALDAPHNYYFSHLLNCPFDCRYCFLQGKFSSANYVLFVNYDDYLQEIEDILSQHSETVHMFSGYDCDSLAYEPITGFADWLVDSIKPNDKLLIELRTKSAQIRQLKRKPVNRSCLVAYSLAPQSIIDQFEQGTARLSERLTALQTLQNQGWHIGLRLDPLIDFEGCAETYACFFEQINAALSLADVHSITLGAMRFPESYYKNIQNLYPNNALIASASHTNARTVGYALATNRSLLSHAYQYFRKHMEPDRIFIHHPQTLDLNSPMNPRV